MDTSIKEIVEYWEVHQDESGLSVNWAEAEILCWRCAHKRKLQRCHIIPRALGGSELPSNLVLLCGQCHSEAPNVNDPEFMWIWLRAHATDFYGTYWQLRGFREYEFVYGRKPFADFEPSLMPKVNQSLAKYFRDTSAHWGQGKVNPATLAWLIRQVEIEVENNP
ncbi:HNH endonuclease [Vibrio metschnikovii]|uniref:HNH endonuclease n=2 Tax=Unclassified Bacteria TaxID=49928 RepID=A0AAU6TP44_UNCXX|nr:HNH endonuclease [Vibrio metschnikovii]EKO3594316.1 HNH endonuclease [Vibrio metschnikovii]EKO3643292.1 HNH endonuclease [Vibrio metschnikovii]EKO3667733.1 HNH endonuclease [Vibrio metschnikovii]EKO3698654.1 HNH endonuclease [Vibrio metschnikovii]